MIGGGGGLHQPLRTGSDCAADLASDYKPDFHYLTVKRVGTQLKVCSIQLKKDFSCFEDGKSMVISKELVPVNDAVTAGAN